MQYNETPFLIETKDMGEAGRHKKSHSQIIEISLPLDGVLQGLIIKYNNFYLR